MVCCVGINSRSGMAEEKLNTEEEETPLQQKLGTIANQLGKLGLYCALIALVASLLNLIIRRLVNPDIGWFEGDKAAKTID
jgi:magnesium-transporting ATPase (P-type)